jgi:uncharacterized protein YjiS (DUF1127 family)
MTAVANDNTCTQPGNAISRYFRKFMAARRTRQGMREMLALGDHLLRDIGVSRRDIYSVMAAPVGSRNERLAQLAEENRNSQMRIEARSSTVRLNATSEQVKLAA